MERVKRRAAGAAGRVFTMLILALLGSITGHGAFAETRDGPVLSWRIERDIRRFRFVAADNAMNLLAIRPGMTILDIGTGTGQFAYEFSRRLNGTGKVYATDTQAYCIDYVRKEAERRGLGNLHPVLVRKDGLDEFYGKHKYDLIAIFHVAMAYDNQVDYLRELRGRLAEGGRLVLVLQKIPTLFSPGDFAGDIRGMIRELSLEPAGSPFFKILKDSTRTLIRENSNVDPPEQLRRAVVEDFNEVLLSDSRFYKSFAKGTVIRPDVGFSPGERAFADFLLLSFNRWMSVDGDVPGAGFETPAAPGSRSVSPPTQASATKADGLFLTKLLFMQKFRTYLKTDGLFTSGFTHPAREAFEEAGFRLQREYPDVVPFEDIVIFAAR